jgi:hypothetical protein
VISVLYVMNAPTEPDAKVLFRIPEDDRSANVETLWAYDLGNDLYKLDNCPFYAYGVSWHDVVYAPRDPDEEMVTFQRVVSKSGNRTVRVIFDIPVEKGNASDQVLQGLVSLGCDYEGATSTYYVINIPSAVDLGSVATHLAEQKTTWGPRRPYLRRGPRQ